MKNLTKKERFDKVVEELKVLEGIDVVSTYYYDQRKIYENQKKCKIDFDFLDLNIIVVNTKEIIGADEKIDKFDDLFDTAIYSALCGEIAYYLNGAVVVIAPNDKTNEETINQINTIYDTYFNKQGDIANMAINDLCGINLLGDKEEELFEDEFGIDNDIDFLDLNLIGNYAEDYIQKKLIRNFTNNIFNNLKSPEKVDIFIDTLADCKDSVIPFFIEVANEVNECVVHDKEDKIYSEYKVNQDFVKNEVSEVTKMN